MADIKQTDHFFPYPLQHITVDSEMTAMTNADAVVQAVDNPSL
jgi:hypothetical protein